MAQRREIDSLPLSNASYKPSWGSATAFDPDVVAYLERAASGATVRDRNSKVILVGNMATGKTSIVNRMVTGKFEEEYKTTIGVDFHIEAFQICTQPFNLHLWDTAGQERFKSITSAYFRGAQSVILVFDVNDLKTLSATRKWLADAVKENAGQDLNVYLVGSKMDLMNRSGIVYKTMHEEAESMAVEFNAEYWEVSSKSGAGIRDLLERVAAISFERAVRMELKFELPNLGRTSTASASARVPSASSSTSSASTFTLKRDASTVAPVNSSRCC